MCLSKHAPAHCNEAAASGVFRYSPHWHRPLYPPFTTGGAWIAAQSQRAALLFIVQAGFSANTAASTVSPAFAGSLALALRPSLKLPVWIMPLVRAANTSAGSSTGALATAVLQPGAQLVFGFGSGK
jgi:hypothetical protein